MAQSDSLTGPALLAAIVDASEDAIVSMSIDGEIASWNPAAERMFGFPAAEAIGRRIDLIVPADRIEEQEQVIARVRRGEKVAHFETTRRSRSGHAVEVSLTVSPIKDASGAIVGYSSIVRAIAERKRTERMAQHLAAVVHSSDDVIVSKDLNGIVQSWNPAAERVFGFTAAEMVGQSITMIIPPDRLGEEAFVLGQVRKGVAVEHFETVRRRKDGTLVDVSLTVSPVRNAAGAIVGASKIARDITERKRFLEIRRSAEHQQQEARRRELEAENRRMQEHSRLKSEFVANMSHELRTPLNAIIGFAELMNRGRGGALSPRHQEYVADILTSARHLLDLINDVLDLAKVESGKLDFRPELVDPAALVREVREIVRGLAAERHLDIEVDAAEVGEVRLDPAKFKQVLYNYVSNAVKFTPEGGRIRIGLLSESATHFRVEVEDTGVGIASADMAKLFVEFQQLDSSASKQYPGTGLGLALTRRIVEAQGGTVGVRSEVGVGSTFFATFPKNVDAFSLVASPRPAAGHA